MHRKMTVKLISNILILAVTIRTSLSVTRFAAWAGEHGLRSGFVVALIRFIRELGNICNDFYRSLRIYHLHG